MPACGSLPGRSTSGQSTTNDRKPRLRFRCVTRPLQPPWSTRLSRNPVISSQCRWEVGATMKTDLFTEDPAERIAELEKQNAELRAMARRMISAWDQLKPHAQGLWAAVEEAGQSQSDAGFMLKKMEVS